MLPFKASINLLSDPCFTSCLEPDQTLLILLSRCHSILPTLWKSTCRKYCKLFTIQHIHKLILLLRTSKTLTTIHCLSNLVSIPTQGSISLSLHHSRLHPNLETQTCVSCHQCLYVRTRYIDISYNNIYVQWHGDPDSEQLAHNKGALSYSSVDPTVVQPRIFIGQH